MGKVGDDLFGEGLLKLFAPYGADRGMAVVSGEETSYTVVLAPPGVDRIFLHNPAVDRMSFRDNLSDFSSWTIPSARFPGLNCFD